MDHEPVYFPPEHREEIHEARERAVRLMTEKNRLKRLIERAEDPPPELVEEYARALATFEIWRDIVMMRERELGKSSFEKRAEAFPEANRAEALRLMREWFRQSLLLTHDFPFSQGMSPELQAMPAKDFVELFNRSKEGLQKDRADLNEKYRKMLDDLMESSNA